MICLITFDTIEEDAYIYFRFAANIAEGFGYVFNQGGPPVEAGTSLVWQLLLVPLYFVDPDLVVGTKLMGVFFGALCLILTQRITRAYVDDEALSCVPSLWLACSFPFYMWSHLGLETPLFLLLLLGLLYCLIDDSRLRYWPVAAFLVVLGRPEGFMMCVMLVPLFFRRTGPKPTLAQGLAFAAMVGAVLVFRLAYFGDVVPHSFYHKIQPDNRASFRILFSVSRDALILVPILAAVPLALISALRKSDRFVDHRFAILLVALLVAMVWAPLGADMKRFSRSFCALLALLYVFLVVVVEPAVTGTRARARVALVVMVAFAPVMLLMAENRLGRDLRIRPLVEAAESWADDGLSPVARLSHLFTPGDHLPRDAKSVFELPAVALYDNHQVAPGEFLALNYPEGIKVVYDQMGQAPWYAGLDKPFIDSLGLTDQPIGFFRFNRKLKHGSFLNLFDAIATPLIRLFGGKDRRRWTREAALDYLFAEAPDVFMVHGIILREKGSFPSQIVADARFKQSYTKRYVVNFAHVFERNDLEIDRDRVRFPENCFCRAIP